MKDNYSSKEVHKGLYTVNSGELPIWVDNIVHWLAMDRTINGWFNDISKYNDARKDKSLLWRMFHGERMYPPLFVRYNPFPQPSAEDLVKFEREYPDMAKEWRLPNER